VSFQFVADKESGVVHRYDCEHAKSIRRRNEAILLTPGLYRQCSWCLGGGREKERERAVAVGEAA
jgi:hypothetical protein